MNYSKTQLNIVATNTVKMFSRRLLQVQVRLKTGASPENRQISTFSRQISFGTEQSSLLTVVVAVRRAYFRQKNTPFRKHIGFCYSSINTKLACLSCDFLLSSQKKIKQFCHLISKKEQLPNRPCNHKCFLFRKLLLG